MIADIINLLKFKPELITHYQKYSLKTTIGIIVFISVACALLPPPAIPEVSSTVNLLIMLLMAPVIMLLTLFLQAWLKIKHKKVTFQALFALMVLTSVIDLLMIPLMLLEQVHVVFYYLQNALIFYSFLVLIFAFAKSCEISVSFSVFSILLFYIILGILIGIVIIILLFSGIMPIPTMPS